MKAERNISIEDRGPLKNLGTKLPHFREFVDLINKRTGVVVDKGKLPMLVNCINERRKKCGQRDLEEYYNFLWFSPNGEEEIQNLIDAVLINETLFYRNKDQMRLLEEAIFPDLIEKQSPGETIKVWSAACATGAEPYSLAICFEETMQKLNKSSAEREIAILATDISRTALETANSGVYHERPVKNAPPEIVKKYMKKKQKDRYEIADSIRGKVTFRHHNLLDSGYPSGLDMIVCRNVLIYFDSNTRKHIIEGFFDALKPDGILMIGHSETLFDWPELFTPHFEHNTVFYTKWTTDRREFLPPGREEKRYRRVQPEEREPAVFHAEKRNVDGATVHVLAISGLLDRNTPVESLRKNLLMFLGRREALKVIDMTKVRYATNHALRVIRQALAAAEHPDENVYIAGGVMTEHLVSADLDDFTFVVKDIEDIRSRPKKSEIKNRESVGHARASSAGVRKAGGVAPAASRPFVLKESSGGLELEIGGRLDPEEVPETNDVIKKAVIDLIRRASEKNKPASILLKEITFIAPACVKIFRRALVLAREEQVLLNFKVTDQRVRDHLMRHGFSEMEGAHANRS